MRRDISLSRRKNPPGPALLRGSQPAFRRRREVSGAIYRPRRGGSSSSRITSTLVFVPARRNRARKRRRRRKRGPRAPLNSLGETQELNRRSSAPVLATREVAIKRIAGPFRPRSERILIRCAEAHRMMGLPRDFNIPRWYYNFLGVPTWYQTTSPTNMSEPQKMLSFWVKINFYIHLLPPIEGNKCVVPSFPANFGRALHRFGGVGVKDLPSRFPTNMSWATKLLRGGVQGALECALRRFIKRASS